MSNPRRPRWVAAFAAALLMLGSAAACSLALLGCREPKTASDRAGRVELKFWHAWGGYEGKALEALVDEFNRTHPKIHVTPSFFAIGDKLLASIAGGKPPDIVTVWDFMLVPMGESGCFIPLEDRLSAAGRTPDSYLPNIRSYGVYGRHTWGVPSTLNAWGLYYNRASVREAGLDPDAPPRTIAELDDWNARLTKVDPATGELARVGVMPTQPSVWIWNFGGDLFDFGARRFVLNSAENVRAVTWMSAQYRRIGMDKWRRFYAGFARPDSPQNPFYIGKIAMKEGGQWESQFIREYAPQLDYAIAPFPSVAGAPDAPPTAPPQGVTRVAGSFWTIPVGTKDPDAAWEFLEWLTAPAQSARFCAALRNIPPLRATLDDPAFAKLRADRDLAFFIDLIQSGRARPIPALPVSQQLTESLDQGLESVHGASREPQPFLDDLQRSISRELERAQVLLDLEEPAK